MCTDTHLPKEELEALTLRRARGQDVHVLAAAVDDLCLATKRTSKFWDIGNGWNGLRPHPSTNGFESRLRLQHYGLTMMILLQDSGIKQLLA